MMETVAVSGDGGTHSDVNAPTMITMEGASPTSVQADRPAPTNAATVFEPAPPSPSVSAPKPDPGMAAATVAEAAALPSVVTVPQMPKGTGEIPQVASVAPSKSKAGLFIVAALLVVLLLGGGVAGFLIWNKSKSKTVATTGPASNPNAPPAAAPREVASYWLELPPATESGKPTKVAALVPLASGQKFNFHFVFSENGYLYIFGPGGEHNQPTAFLTTKPLPETGVTSNKVVQDKDFDFPRGDSLKLDDNPGVDTFTVIFSKSALATPAFLNEPVTGEALSTTQQAELKAFAAKYKDKPPLTEPDESTAGAPVVRVKVPPDQTGNPVVFDIRIQHN
jgi:hypothetical protein